MAAIIYFIRERPSEYVPRSPFDSTISYLACLGKKRLRFLEPLDPCALAATPVYLPSIDPPCSFQQGNHNSCLLGQIQPVASPT